MKTKRVLLHGLILLLAVICMGAGMYVGYWESRAYDVDFKYEYNYDYAVDAWTILEYGYAQSQMITEFGDENKVLIENEELGNVTVKDIVEIFEDKYSDYYKYYSQYSNFTDYEEYGYDAENENTAVLYETDRALMRAYKDQWKENGEDLSLKEKYQYYKAKCDYVDQYAKLAETLQCGVEESGDRLGDIDTLIYVHETYPCVFNGTKYYLKYTLNGEEYLVTNSDIDEFLVSGNGIVDITTNKDGQLVQDNPLYGEKDFVDVAYNIDAVKFLEQIDIFYMAVDTNIENTYFSYYIDRIEAQLLPEEIVRVDNYMHYCFAVIIATLVIALLIYIRLMFMAGHRVEGDDAQLYNSDKQWWDIVAITIGVVGFCAFWFVIEVYESGYYQMAAIISVMLALPLIEAILWLSESFMRRVKTKTLMDTTLWGKIWLQLRKGVSKLKVIFEKIWSNVHLAWKVLTFIIVIIGWNGVAAFIAYDWCEVAITAVMIIFEAIILGALVWLYFDENKKIKDGANKISLGDIEYKIDNEMRFSANESLKNSINSIGDGLQNAISESIKNERMKTELIANVSHDLKTPLTSIINYVDLLKTEGIDSQNAEKYLDVLDQKSQRLKHLTEDLVEVSKLNSGAVALQLEKLDIVQLVKQSLGEFSEKFAERNLQVIKNIQKEPIFVMADGRKTWRLFENLYQNVYKYAMPGTRVYIDIIAECGQVTVSVKNISEGPLNFSADELTERFVRGDVSRTTEGSGLGLSIAQSIAQRQGGSMNIVLDGDLFKVEVMMSLA